MPQQLVSPDEFVARVTKAFEQPDEGAVWLTHKRYTYEGADDADDDMGEAEYDVLIRCTHGSSKFSSRIPASALPTFHAAYGALLKQAMAPRMRKRDKKREKARADALAKRRKEVYVDVDVGDAGKRGKGRRQRMRKIAAQRKKEAEREKIEAREAARAPVGA
ncbi:hypothetical protein Q5752_000918 [Cryptotrichosporon argae]